MTTIKNERRFQVLIAGSRSINDQNQLVACMEHFFRRYAQMIHIDEVAQIISGTARGVDRMGEAFAFAHHIPVDRHPANWKELGKKAGIVRNIEMAEFADFAIILWDGTSVGTKHMSRIMHGKGKSVFLYTLQDDGSFSFRHWPGKKEQGTFL
jgi:hypothetical protein